MHHRPSHQPLRELNGGPSPRYAQPTKPQPRATLSLLDLDCLAEIARRLSPGMHFCSFRATSKACQQASAIVIEERKILQSRGYRFHKVHAAPSYERGKFPRFVIVPAVLNSLKAPSHVAPSHLAICDSHLGGIELLSLASHVCERWGSLHYSLVSHPIGVAITPLCLRVGSGDEARVECHGITYVVLAADGYLLKTDGDMMIQRLSLSAEIGGTDVLGCVKTGSMAYIASQWGILGVDVGKMRIISRSPLSSETDAVICGVTSAPVSYTHLTLPTKRIV